MTSFDAPVEQPSARETTQRLPPDGDLERHTQHQPRKHIADAPRNRHEELVAMLLELQSNRLALEGLARWYRLFVFTGGQVPTAQWNFATTTSYHEHPLATDSPTTSDIQRYQHMIQAIHELGKSGTGPTKLRYRRDLGHKFAEAASELRILTDALELSVTKAIKQLQPTSA